MEYSIRAAYRRLSFLQRIPSEADPRLEVRKIIVIEKPTGSWAGEFKGQRRRSICRDIQVRKISTRFVRHAVELVPQPKVQREIRAQLPTVLGIKTIFALPEFAVIGSRAHATLIEVLTLELCVGHAYQHPAHILNRGVRNAIDGSQAEVVERVKCQSVARREGIESVLEHESELRAEFQGVGTFHPREVIREAVSAGSPALPIAIA